MNKVILIDEFRVTFFAPDGLRAGQYDRINRALDGARYRARLSRIIRGFCRRYPALSGVRVKLTR
jgi:hypothetical protein